MNDTTRETGRQAQVVTLPVSDNAVANFFAGQGSPETIIQTVNQAASTS